MTQPTSPPISSIPTRAAQVLLLVDALIWIGLGISAVIYFPEEEAYATMAWVVVGLMFANALVFLGVAWGVGRGSHFLFWLGVVQTAVNLVLSVTDQFGWFDLLVLLLNAVLLGLLFAQRKRFGVQW